MRSGKDQLIEQLFLAGFGLEGGEKPDTGCSGDSVKDRRQNGGVRQQHPNVSQAETEIRLDRSACQKD